ncbi:MAG: diaminopimelate epimerase [Elusimicrobia bacterium]|nr:diaminopimelate epimerase [Elusimicrobiota bacterium]
MKFWKMTGGGNDFVLIENKTGLNLSALAIKLCDRKFSVGADGLLALSFKKNILKVRYFNSDGSEAFCGNGSRCSALWAFKNKIKDKKIFLDTFAGILGAFKGGKNKILLEMPPLRKISFYLKSPLKKIFPEIHFAYLGVPHAVVIVKDERKIDVFKYGNILRNSALFYPQGANINFACLRNGKIFIRTYERGVENETLACGSGMAASAAVFWSLKKVKNMVKLVSASKMEFLVKIEGEEKAEKIWAQGPAKIIFKGETYG